MVYTVTLASKSAYLQVLRGMQMQGEKIIEAKRDDWNCNYQITVQSSSLSEELLHQINNIGRQNGRCKVEIL